MEIINVIKLKGGMIEEVKSFPIMSEEKKTTIVKKAEDYFTDKIKGCLGYDANEKETYLEDGYFEDGCGIEAFLTWSV